jgi:hypothetical protein
MNRSRDVLLWLQGYGLLGCQRLLQLCPDLLVHPIHNHQELLPHLAMPTRAYGSHTNKAVLININAETANGSMRRTRFIPHPPWGEAHLLPGCACRRRRYLASIPSLCMLSGEFRILLHLTFSSSVYLYIPFCSYLSPCIP